MLIGYQIRNHGVDSPHISVDEVKESLRREMVAGFLEMNTGMMGTGMDSTESLRREIMAEINRVLTGAGQDKEYLRVTERVTSSVGGGWWSEEWWN